jgi:UDP-3-O-[3-hydroxymyristoyl] glucosamine N-acyltransferase
VGVAGHVTIGKGASAVGQSGITNSLPDGAFVSGYPAIDNREWLKSSAIFRKLPDMRKKIADLEQRIVDLEARLKSRPTKTAVDFGSARRKSRPRQR